MKVQDILRAKGDNANRCATVQPDATVDTVSHRLKLEGCGALVVSSDGERVEGIVSERDIVRGLPEHGGRLLDMPVSDIMTREVQTCSPGDNVTEIMGEMTRRRIRHLPVTEDGKLSGIISIGDVVKNRLDELETETHVLRDYIVGRS
ncbi:MAG: CBS domain-containing protein [Pseudomonadota bacterium]